MFFLRRVIYKKKYKHFEFLAYLKTFPPTTEPTTKPQHPTTFLELLIILIYFLVVL